MRINWEHVGGRKFALTIAGLVTTVALAKFNAPGDAYLAVGAMIAAFSGANAWTTVKAELPRAGTPARPTLPDDERGDHLEREAVPRRPLGQRP